MPAASSRRRVIRRTAAPPTNAWRPAALRISPRLSCAIIRTAGMLLLAPIQTVPGDRDRRWISDDYFDLVLWYEADREQVYGFQLCYGKPIDERALTWTRERGFTHQAIDTGEAS